MELVGGSIRNSSGDSHGGLNNRADPASLSLDDRFDASQYAFFGRDVTQEFEIGGLDEEEEEDTELLGRETFKPVLDVADGKQREGDKSASDLGGAEQLITSFTKLGRNGMPMSEEGEIGSLGVPKTGPDSISAEASSQPVDWLDHTTEAEQGARMWWLNNQQQSTLGAVGDVQDQQLKQHGWGVDLNSVQAVSSSVSTPPLLPQRTQHALQALPTGNPHIVQAPLGHTKPYPFLQPPLGGLSSMPPYLAGLPHQYSSIGPTGTPLLNPAQFFPQSSVQIAPAPGLGSQQFHHHVSLMPPQVVLQYQRHAPQMHAAPPSHPFNLKSQTVYNIPSPPPQMLSKMGEGSMALDSRDHFLSRLRQTQRHNQHSMADGNFPGRGAHNSWQPLRSKYMTVEDIENIVRIQWAATHSSDPYIDDYYHQAVQTKLSAVSSLGRRQFAPSHLRDLPSHTRASAEPHAYLQVDALGRVPFSSIRRPRPLLDVDPGVGSSSLPDVGQAAGSLVNGLPQHKPLEQEPMLAARIAIEDSLCLLLDVDDVDRLLSLAQAPDGGALLRQRRQLLLERLAVSLELVEANGVNNSGRTVTGSLFLRIMSLSKGQKLLIRYLHLLTPGTELVPIVAMAVFRHLRFLFGGMHSDPSSSAAAVGLANATVLSILSMDLPALSACLAAVVTAPEQPPLRPMGSPAGDGATVVLRAVLERATGLLTDPNSAYPVQNREIWQASFDAFFKMVAEYCTNKYDSIFHALMMGSPGNLGAINTAAAVEMSKEMPVELLRASLPHTNDHQRKRLLEFTQRSMVMSPFPSQTGNDGHAKTASIHGRS